MTYPNIRFEQHTSIATIQRSQWHALASGQGPFLQYEWFELLEKTGCVAPDKGWKPAHWTAEIDGELIAVIPGFLKTDSYGEYIFDHSWANAYQHHGLAYYPKWISAVPFTPVTGARILCQPGTPKTTLQKLRESIEGWAQTANVSSCHYLFSKPSTRADFNQQGYLTRYSVQFQWQNRDYDNFDDFLLRLTSRKRKSIKKTRQGLRDKGLQIERLTADSLTTEDITLFIRCYQDTYYKRSGHSGYLTPEFFYQLQEHMGDNILLVKASLKDKPIACALFLYDSTGLYGRYWGALQQVNELHFECCYFQGIEFAITHKLPIFNPGTQGEHKILRGFEPIYCVSHHKLFASNFHAAVADFLRSEEPAIKHYFNQAQDVLPFNEAYKNEFIKPGD